MEKETIGAGELRDRIEILTLQEVGTTYTWEVAGRSWAKSVLTSRRNNFSVHGVGAAGVTFTIRRQPMDLGHALLWEGRHCHITGVIPLGRNHLVVEAALAEVVQCAAAGEMTRELDELNRPRLKEGEDISFPAVVTEKYQRTEPDGVHDTTETVLILTVPKLVPLLPVGRLVTIDGAAPLQVRRASVSQSETLESTEFISGDLSQITGPPAGPAAPLGTYEILTVHPLDRWHNEYEVVRRTDV